MSVMPLLHDRLSQGTSRRFAPAGIKSLVRHSATAVCLLTATFAHSQSKSLSPQQQIEPLLQEMDLAANEHDTDRFMAVFLHQTTLTFVIDGSVTHGWDDLREQQAKWWSDGKTESLRTTMDQLVALRDAFVLKTKTAGFSCPMEPPKILLADIASFGNYDPETNALQTPAWEQLSTDKRSFFFKLAGPGADEKAAHEMFERGTHKWVFIHEMGHWWQACAKANTGRKPYGIEYDANRIAAAYWRETDPDLMSGLNAGFEHILDGAPNPVPPGQTTEAYFNANYGKLAHSPDYTWFQAQMVGAVHAERPAPTFAQTLEEAATRACANIPLDRTDGVVASPLNCKVFHEDADNRTHEGWPLLFEPRRLHPMNDQRAASALS